MEVISGYLSDAGNILLTILAFGFIIFVHELGHFIMAKRAGVKVDRFYIGFDFGGLKIFSFKYKETEYGLGVFPFGGYVKLHGIEELPGHESEVKDLPDEHFQKKTVGERFGIMAGGVAMNFISAVILIIIMYGFGKLFVGPVIGEVSGPAYEAGLMMNDKILSINNEPVKTFYDIQKVVLMSDPGETLPFKVERDGKEVNIDVVSDLDPNYGLASVGISPKIGLVIGLIDEDSPAFRAGLKVNDRVSKVNGKEIKEYYEFEEIVEKSAGQKLKIEVIRDDKPIELEMLIESTPSFLCKYTSGLQSNFLLEIAKAQKGRAAYESGFRSGDSIVAIDGNPVYSLKDVSDALANKKGGEVEVEVLRGQEKIKNTLTPRFSLTLRKYLMDVQLSMLGGIREIEEIEVNGPADISGLKVNDLIVSIDGVPVNTKNQLLDILKKNKDSEITIGYKRDGQILTTKLQLRSTVSKSFFSKIMNKAITLFSGHKYINDSFGLGVKFKKKFFLTAPKEGSHADLAGFKEGDELLSFSYTNPNTNKIKEYKKEQLQYGWVEIDFAFTELARAYSIKEAKFVNTKIDPKQLEIHVRYLRGDQEMVTTISPASSEDNLKGYSGIYFDNDKILLKYDSLGSAFKLVLQESYGMLEYTAQSLGKLVSGKISSESMSGPVGVINIAHKYAKLGPIELIWLVAMLSINIGFLNFMPFPPLDGGAIFFLLIEKIKGSPVSAKFQMGFQNVGVILLVSLMLFVTINDVGRLF